MNFGPVHIDHIGIATHQLDDHTPFWRLLGLIQGDRDVTTRFFSTSPVGESTPVAKIELLEATGKETPIGRFLEKRGPGVQQVCLSVGNLEGLLAHLLNNGVRLIDEQPRMVREGN